MLTPPPSLSAFLLLPTHRPQTLAYFLPVTVRRGVTITVLPLRVLLEDALVNARHDRLEVSTWPLENPGLPPRLVIVSAEEADAIKGWAGNLAAQGKLDLIVLDEAHLYLTSDYRPLLRPLLQHLGELAAPMLYMTATLAPSMEEALRREVRPGVAVLRSPSTRPNLAYKIVKFTKVEESTAEMLRLIHASDLAGPARAVVFCLTEQRTREVADDLQASGVDSAAYYGGLPQERKRELLAQYKSGEIRVVVGTTAFGAGVSIPCIRIAIFLGGAHMMLDFVQGGGRCGRDGLPAEVWVLVDPTHRATCVQPRERLCGHPQVPRVHRLQGVSPPGHRALPRRPARALLPREPG